jgi:type II secretory pathway component PulL
MAQTYRQAFPEGGQLNRYNPRQQMESRLASLRRGGGGDSGLLHLLQTAGPLLAADADLQILGLAYRNNGLDLEISAKNLQSIDQLKQRLEAAPGLGVEVVSARAEGERAQGKLRLEASS